MFAGRLSSTRRRRRTVSEPPQPSKTLERRTRTNTTHFEGQHRIKQKSVQWAGDVKKEHRQAGRSDSAISYDQALKKLSRAADLLERSQSLEEDFEETLRKIRGKLKEEKLADNQDTEKTQTVTEN